MRYYIGLIFISCALLIGKPTFAQSDNLESEFRAAVEKGISEYHQAIAHYKTALKDSSLVYFLEEEAHHREHNEGYGADTLASLGIHLADSLGLTKKAIHLRIILGQSYFRMGYYDRSEALYLLADSLFKNTGTPNPVASFQRLAIVYTYQGKYDLAISNYLKVLEHHLSMDDKPNPGWYTQMGYLYYLLEDYPQALMYHQWAEKRFHQLPDENRDWLVDYIRGEAGAVYLATNQPDSAYTPLMNAYKTYREHNNWRGVAYQLHYLGNLHLMENQMDSAIWYLKQSGRINEVLNNKNMLAQTYMTLGKVYQAQQNTDSAEYWLTLSLKMAQQPKAREVTKDVYYALSRLHEDLDEPQKALAYLHQYDSLRTQILDESIRRMQHLAEEYYWNWSDEQVTALQQESKLYTRLTWTAVGIAIFGLATLGLMVNRYRLRSTLAERRQRMLSLEQTNARLSHEKLKAEMEHQQRELASTTLHAMQKNELLRTLREGLETIAKRYAGAKPTVNQLCKQIDQGLQHDNDWENFKLHFEQVHPSFFTILKEEFPHLSPNDLKHCAYLRINLSVKEVAQILGINATSVTMSRYRLKKKLNLEQEDSLNDYIQQIELKSHMAQAS